MLIDLSMLDKWKKLVELLHKQFWHSFSMMPLSMLFITVRMECHESKRVYLRIENLIMGTLTFWKWWALNISKITHGINTA